MPQASPEYDLPDEGDFENFSEAFHSFFYEFFVESMTIHRGETDFWYVPNLSKNELQLARELIRDNLQLKYVHLIEGAALLNDRQAVPLLRNMLDHEGSLSLRLTIAGSLWKIAKDPLFINALQEMIETDEEALILAHADQIKWLGDTRSIDMLMQLLNSSHSTVRRSALSSLNVLEHRELYPAGEYPHSIEYYLERREDKTLKQTLVHNLIEWYQAR